MQDIGNISLLWPVVLSTLATIKIFVGHLHTTSYSNMKSITFKSLNYVVWYYSFQSDICSLSLPLTEAAQYWTIGRPEATRNESSSSPCLTLSLVWKVFYLCFLCVNGVLELCLFVWCVLFQVAMIERRLCGSGPLCLEKPENCWHQLGIHILHICLQSIYNASCIMSVDIRIFHIVILSALVYCVHTTSIACLSVLGGEYLLCCSFIFSPVEGIFFPLSQ